MGPKQLAGVMDIVARNSAAGRGLEVDEEALQAQTSALEAQIERESTALFSTGRLWDDGIIHPADSRTALGSHFLLHTATKLLAPRATASGGTEMESSKMQSAAPERTETVPQRPINKLLIANRGEIAVRIARTAHRLGIGTVGVYSEPDANALHVDSVDVAVSLGGETPAQSYLRGDAIIGAAKATGADASTPVMAFLPRTPISLARSKRRD